MIVQVTADIHNMADKDLECGYIVARRVWNLDKKLVELWYYGCYESEEDAQAAAHEIGNGIILGYKKGAQG